MDLDLPFHVISDTHWFDLESIEVYGRSPDYNERLIENWNSVVSDEGIVVHLGDLVISEHDQFAEIAKKLNGHKFLVKGNRDNHPESWYNDLGFTLIHPFELRYGKFRVNFSHRPNILMLPHELNIHGHIHAASVAGLTERHINVSVEVRDYKPQPVEQLITTALRRVHYA